MDSVVKSFRNSLYVQLAVALAQLRARAYVLPTSLKGFWKQVTTNEQLRLLEPWIFEIIIQQSVWVLKKEVVY